MLRWMSSGNIFNDRDLISVLGPAPSGEASESFPAPPGGPDERGAGAPSVCVRPRREARSGDAPSLTSQEGVFTGEPGGHSGHPPEGAPHVIPLG